jgi:sterol desaturase/sphingolipid hydroxylase (fatty acid hydroxylase superfamily)
MGLLSLEQDRTLVWADFAFYGLMVVLLAAAVLHSLPGGHAGRALACVGAGLGGWTLAEYALHRYVLHGLQPFKRWHALHHARPQALIATPTLLTAALFALLVLLPAWWLFPLWSASALVLGVALGYLAYIVTHHAVHHAHGSSRWLRRHKRWHALHHREGSMACYGVSLPLWDHLLGSARPQVRQRTDSAP